MLFRHGVGGGGQPALQDPRRGRRAFEASAGITPGREEDLVLGLQHATPAVRPVTCLADCLHTGLPRSYEELLRIAIDVADAMAYLHPKVVHRDLKPQNVLLTSEGRAKICDFGVSRLKDRTYLSTKHIHVGTIQASRHPGC